MRSRAVAYHVGLAIFLVCVVVILSFPQSSGAQWEKTGGPESGSIRGLVASGKTLFACTEEGWFLSADNGAKWTAVNAPFPLKLNSGGFLLGYGLLIGEANLLAYAESGIFLSADNGRSWKSISSGLPAITEIRGLEVIGTNLFAVTDRGLFLSTDNGESWKAVNSGLANTDVSDLDAIGMSLFAYTDSGCFISTDNGTSWKAVSGLPDSGYFSCSAVVGTNLFAAPFDIPGLCLSTDGGANWSGTSLGEEEGLGVEFRIGFPFVEHLAVIGKNLIATAGITVFLSTNNGASWNRFNGEECGLAGIRVLCLKVIGTNLFAGTWGGGVFLSTNNGASWRAVNSGLTNLIIRDLEVIGTDLFAGTFGSGVWRLPLIDIIPER